MKEQSASHSHLDELPTELLVSGPYSHTGINGVDDFSGAPPDPECRHCGVRKSVHHVCSSCVCSSCPVKPDGSDECCYGYEALPNPVYRHPDFREYVEAAPEVLTAGLAYCKEELP